MRKLSIYSHIPENTERLLKIAEEMRVATMVQGDEEIKKVTLCHASLEALQEVKLAWQKECNSDPDNYFPHNPENGKYFGEATMVTYRGGTMILVCPTKGALRTCLGEFFKMMPVEDSKIKTVTVYQPQ